MTLPLRTLLLCALTGACAAAPQEADLILTGGTVWRGPGAAPATAVAVRGGRVLAVGSDEEVRSYAAAGTREIALRGRLVVPGFSDDHVHFMAAGFQLASVDLRDAATPVEFSRRIHAFASSQPAGTWITGGDWDHERWPGGPLPQRAWIDSVTPAHPVLVSRLDGHMALANTLALERAGITRDTPDPPGGTIVRDPRTGEPTGVLKDEAMGLVSALIPPPTERQRDEAFRRAQEWALARGVTMIHDMGSWADLETYRRAQERGDLTMRIYAFVPLAT